MSDRSNSLCEGSDFYHRRVNYYERFAQCEDAPGHVARLLLNRARAKRVLDVGCGTGKYLDLLEDSVEKYCGIDRAAEALDVAAQRLKQRSKVRLVHGSAETLGFDSDSFDLVFACWVLGTIQEPARRAAVINECLRVLKPGGEILLVENDIGGEFEKLRGRYPKIERTKAYNDNLEQLGFSCESRFETYFEFDTTEEARQIFGGIWGDAAAQGVRARRIEHRVVTYRLVKG